MTSKETNAKPLQFHPDTGEVFLPIRNQPQLILTPHRADDGARMIEYLNHPKIWPMLTSPPFPFTAQDAEDWLIFCQKKHDILIQQIENGSPESFYDDCPARVIRYLNADGTDTYIGSCSIWRMDEMGLEEPVVENKSEETVRRVEANKAKSTGDPSIVWTIGYWLDPAYHGKGYMTDIVATLLEFAEARMNVKRIIGTAFEENGASMKVFTKNGFIQRPEVFKDYTVARGQNKSLMVADWTKP